MATPNKITVTRNRIDQTIKDLADQLDFSTSTLECDWNEDCSIFVDVECHEGEYREMEIVTIEIIKDGIDSNLPYPNIADYMGRKLDAIVRKMNDEEYQNAQDWEYQREYETIGARIGY